MAFLERNLEQLTHVQRQLVEQNSGLKKEVAIAERKLIARNERIQSLESLLQDSQEKLTAANHRYLAPVPPHHHGEDPPPPPPHRRPLEVCLTGNRFETQLTAVKDRLEAAKIGTKGLGNPAQFSFQGSRIAKPLRGGGGGAVTPGGDAANMPGAVLSGAAGSSASQEGQAKRSSWFFDRSR